MIATVGSDHLYGGLPLEGLGAFSAISRTSHAVALHPSGLYVLVVFPSQAKLLALLENEAADVAEVEALGTSHVSFARGGHFFALVNNSVVTVYDTFSCEKKYSLRAASRVATVVWKKGDRQIATVGRDGSCATWDLATESRAEEAEGAPKAPFYDGAASSDLKRVFCGEDNT